MDNYIKKFIKYFLGKKAGQRFFEFLYRASLKGMNIGLGADVETSGEAWVLRYVRDKISKSTKAIVFDVGANIGNYSTLVERVFTGRTVQIHAFEPSPKTFAQLEKNTKDKNNITIHNFGFGDSEKTVTLYSTEGASGLASIYHRQLDHLNTVLSEQETISLKSIDDFCSQSGIQHIHFLKLDVEGNELAVLKGAQRMMAEGSIDFIQFEFGGTAIDAKIYLRDFYYLLKDRYHLYRILKNGLRRIEQYNETQEIFLTTNFLAEKK